MKAAERWNEYKYKHEKSVSAIRRTLILIAASFAFAAGFTLFALPYRINLGGFLGVAQILEIVAGGRISVGIWLAALNAPLMIVAFKYFSRAFASRTAAEVALICALIYLAERYNAAAELFVPDTANISLISLIGGALVGGGIAMTLSIEGSSGGTDILGLLLQKKYRMSNVSRLFLLFDVAVAAVYAAVLRSSSVFFYSCTALAAYQLTLEFIFNGMSNAVMFEIITEDSAGLAAAIDSELHRGSTMFRAVGTYTKREKQVVICVVRKRQEAKARELLKKLAPDSFTYTLPIKEVIGKGFRNVNF